jgi:hypothetical protein
MVIAQNEDLFIRQCRHKDSLTSSGGRESFTWYRIGKPGWSMVRSHSNAEASSIPVSAKSLAVIPVIFSGDNVTRKVCSFCDLCEQTRVEAKITPDAVLGNMNYSVHHSISAYLEPSQGTFI